MKRAPVLIAGWLLACVLAACGAGQPAASQPTPQPSAAPTALPSAAPTAAQPTPQPSAAPTALPTPGPDQFANPVIDQDFPDPDVLQVGGEYYAYATNSAGKNIQVARSADLVAWQMLDDALPIQPDWAALNFGLIWAPEVTSWDGGKTFTMYFVARDTASDKQCIGVATSAQPAGPFKGAGAKPLICQSDLGGSIDASAFADDDGQRYLLWKNDGNCCGLDTWLYIQPVAADGLTLSGQPTKLIKEDQSWEGQLVEAPTLWKHGGKYYLFYSANSYAGADYAIGYAVADAPTGPFSKPGNGPLLATDFKSGVALGPGGQDVVVGKHGETWLMYHSWDSTVAYRRISLARLTWQGDTPVVQPPSRAPMPKP
ncbi:family 43 glycosylhydrolase [Kouleothrix sp.]|uniref:family 43 glycosylhydrolase n=1 Tax=Kouleothrix sp. TaxID=2779161 RepID=UPI00391BD8C9